MHFVLFQFKTADTGLDRVVHHIIYKFHAHAHMHLAQYSVGGSGYDL